MAEEDEVRVSKSMVSGYFYLSRREEDDFDIVTIR